MITETDELAEAMRVGKRAHPDLDGARLISALAVERARALEDEARSREEAFDRLVGSVDYPPGYLEELREGWPG